MATVWSVLADVFADARKADDLATDPEAWRELRLDPDAALAGFALWPGTEPAEEREARAA